MSDCPGQLLHGEVQRLELTLRNSGRVGMRSLRMKLSQPAFFGWGVRGWLRALSVLFSFQCFFAWSQSSAVHGVHCIGYVFCFVLATD